MGIGCLWESIDWNEVLILPITVSTRVFVVGVKL